MIIMANQHIHVCVCVWVCCILESKSSTCRELISKLDKSISVNHMLALTAKHSQTSSTSADLFDFDVSST